ncbi:MAG TPA: DUF4398 domain-containing protein [Stellaceae bacterium]|nr:DUF4398 domain-containing protein [Stellaceae bacterium]
MRAKAIIAGTLLLAACARGEPPTTQLAVAQAAIDAAVSAGATERAPETLTMARDKLSEANQAAATGKYADARRWAEEAEIDAKLASAETRTSFAKADLRSAEQSNTLLKHEIERGSPTGAKGGDRE